MCFRYVAVICYFISAKYNPKMDLKNIFFKNRQCLLIMTLFFPLKILHFPSFEKFLIFKCFWKKKSNMSSIYFHFVSNNSPRRWACSFIWRNKTHFTCWTLSFYMLHITLLPVHFDKYIYFLWILYFSFSR